mgnify:CR=1 FL=1
MILIFLRIVTTVIVLNRKNKSIVGIMSGVEHQEEEDAELRYGVILALISIVMIVGAMLHWHLFEGERYLALQTWYYAPLAFSGGFVALLGSFVHLRVYRFSVIQKYRPFTDGVVGMIGSLIVLGAVLYFLFTLSAGNTPAYGLVITFAGAIGGILASAGVFKKSSPRIPKGYSDEDVSPRLGD